MLQTSLPHGAPLPTDWTPNSGPTCRALEPGMEIRYPGGAVFHVYRTNPTGASIVGRDKERILRRYGKLGNVVSETAYAPVITQVISLHSEVDYRLDTTPFDKVEYEDTDGHIPTVTRRFLMATATATKARVAAAPVEGGKAPKSAAAPKAKREVTPKVEHACICGCGGKTTKFFVPGHDAKFKGWLNRIRDGKKKASEVMPEPLIKALGPWTKEGEGSVPAKTYQQAAAKLRAA